MPITTHNLLANDLDPDGDPLEVTSFTQPAHGTVLYAGDGGTDVGEVTVLVSAV